MYVYTFNSYSTVETVHRELSGVSESWDMIMEFGGPLDQVNYPLVSTEISTVSSLVPQQVSFTFSSQLVRSTVVNINESSISSQEMGSNSPFPDGTSGEPVL